MELVKTVLSVPCLPICSQPSSRQGSFTMPWTSLRRDSCGLGVKNYTGANVKSIGFEYVDPCRMEGLASLIWGGLGEL
jgi:hypothetical protein